MAQHLTKTLHVDFSFNLSPACLNSANIQQVDKRQGTPVKHIAIDYNSLTISGHSCDAYGTILYKQSQQKICLLNGYCLGLHFIQ